MKVSICLCTFKRPDQLALLLQDLCAQTRLPDELIVVDNDPQGSGRATVEACKAPFVIRYDIQPIKNISLTRNRTVALATGDWMALIDDDERATPRWLEHLLDAAQKYSAGGVMGRVDRLVPEGAPDWIIKSGYFDYERFKTGEEVPANKLWLGNFLLRADYVRAEPGPFDEAFGLTGGGDGDMLSRLAKRGCKMVWCDEALVTEIMEPSRLNREWILMRALRGGGDHAVHWRNGRYGAVNLLTGTIFVLRAALQALVAAILALLTLPLGRHRSFRWQVKVWANAGKLMYLSGWRHREYAKRKN